MDLVSLSTIRTRAKSAADMINDGLVADTEWNAWINYGARRLHDMLCSKFGDEYFIKSASVSTTQGSNVAPLPADFYRERSIDFGQGANAITLRRMSFKDRNKYNWASVVWGGSGAVPFYTISGTNLLLYPSPSVTGATLTLWYYPTLQVFVHGTGSITSASLVNDDDTIDGVNGFEELVVLEAAIRAKLKDDSDASALMAQRAEVLGWIDEAARQRNAGQPTFVGEMRDDSGLFPGDGGAFWTG